MKLIIFILTLTLGFEALAQSYNVQRRDMKLASQQLVEKDTFTDPEAADADQLLNDQATSSSAVTTVTSFLAQPDVCRTLSIIPAGTTTDVAAGNVTVTGRNTLGQVITEDFAFLANASTATAGTKAFCSVSSVVFPIQDGNGATWDVGTADKLGLKRCLATSGDLLYATVDGVYEGTRPTITTSASDVSLNTIDTSTAYDGAKEVRAYYFQNFQCVN
jgi:hypothetical protein